MKVVIDTNVFWVSTTRKSKTNWLFQALLNGDFVLCVTTDILAEYEELISNRIGYIAATTTMELLDILPNVEYITTYYKWRLIKEDPDDDKFVDCYVAGQASSLVTHDKHFNVLEKIEFPPVNVISLEAFKDKLKNQQ